ncbi:MAG: ATP synthase F0 subunit C [Candidatus Cloacimonadota bacterium]|nr:MAG: ATP synthase F0 subunit C [Candidatus Cloacimonadota bacterium]
MEVSTEILKLAAFFGAGISVGIASLSAGMGEGYTAGHASTAIMRQPKANDTVVRSMLISQAVTETGAIFALVVSLLLIFGGFFTDEGGWYKAASLLAAGLAIGIGSVGPGFGSGYTGGQAMKSIGRMPSENNALTANMLIGQALSQTSSIFSLVVALLLLYSTPNQPSNIALETVIFKSTAFLAAGLAIGLGTLGPGSGIGYVAGSASDMMGRFPGSKGKLSRTMFLGAAVSESTAIYSLVIALLLIFAI